MQVYTQNGNDRKYINMKWKLAFTSIQSSSDSLVLTGSMRFLLCLISELVKNQRVCSPSIIAHHCWI
jgi:hypothetical protein